MHKLLFTSLTTSLFAFGLTACGSSDSNPLSDLGGINSSDQTSMPAPNQTPVTVSAPEGLNGTWSTGCVTPLQTVDIPIPLPVDIAGLPISFEETLTINNDVATQQARFFTNTDCESSIATRTIDASYSMAYGSAVATDLGNAIEVNKTLEIATVDGQTAVAQDLEDEDLLQRQYGIMLVSDSVLYRSKWSDSLDGSTPERRPNSLDQSVPLYRQ